MMCGASQTAIFDHVTERYDVIIVGSGAGTVDRDGHVHLAYKQTNDAEADGLYHELHNEPEQQEVLDGIVAWLDAHLEAVPASPGSHRRST